MNTVRSVITVFILLLIGTTIAGWVWAADLPMDKSIGSRVILTISALFGIVGLVAIWLPSTASRLQSPPTHE